MTSTTKKRGHGPAQPPSDCDCGHAKDQHISGYFACYAPDCHCSKFTLPGRRDPQPARLPGSAA